ncbi:MAG: alpha-L-fucosidase precursor [Lentisphaerae bacterium]|jgi:alpha-L-fucosidase|nr:alpha-L-fucosidase precursor [Lentisphaerota bacterium]
MPHLTVLPNNEFGADSTPTYLFDYAEEYRTNAPEAGRSWFRDARYGLAVRYGLHSLIGKGDQVQYIDKIPVQQYELLKNKFTAVNFDPVEIAECAIAGGFRYIDFCARGADGFCLFQSAYSEFSSATSPAQRDLVAEMASVCEYHGLGLCLHYSHGQDWRHPHAPNQDLGGPFARPNYPLPDPAYHIGVEHQLDVYLEFVSAQIQELLNSYGPIAAICLDGIAGPLYLSPEKFHCSDLYRLIRHLQPQVLVSYQQGLTGEEDFFAVNKTPPGLDAAKAEQGFVNIMMNKPLEIRDSLTPDAWGYHAELAGNHLNPDDVWKLLEKAAAFPANLTLNTNLMPDGSLDLEDINTIIAVGCKIEKHGFPRI